MLADLADAAFSFWLFFVIHGWMREGEATFGAMLDALESGDLATSASENTRTFALAIARIYTGGFRSGLGRYDEAIGMLEAGTEVLVAHELGRCAGLGLNMLAAALTLKGQHDDARERLWESLAQFREIGDEWGAAFSLTDLGMVTFRYASDEDGERFCEEGRQTFRRLGDRRGQAFAASSLGQIALARGDHQRAARLFREALALREEVGDRWGVAMARVHLGRVFAARREHDRARDHLLRALRIAWSLSITPIVVEALAELASLNLSEGDTHRAREILAAVIDHPAAPKPVRERARTLMGEENVNTGPRDPVGCVNDHARALLSA
jgi:tetratricopeptide (TPR) repeat protein